MFIFKFISLLFIVPAFYFDFCKLACRTFQKRHEPIHQPKWEQRRTTSQNSLYSDDEKVIDTRNPEDAMKIFTKRTQVSWIIQKKKNRIFLI